MTIFRFEYTNAFVVRANWLAVALLLFSQCCMADPQAQAGAMVTFGQARFTVLTPELIRMEYSGEQHFEDRASLAVIHRNLPLPNFTQKIVGKTLSISTRNLRLSYTDTGEAFNEKNLKVDIIFDKNTSLRWNPSLTDSANLKGTLRTLDQAKGWNFADKLESGLISRQGWALLDDSRNLLFDGDKDWNWVTPRTNAAIDWYLFAHGSQYKKALNDFTQIAGKIPMPPKYAFGYWWSRYWIYNDRELRELVGNLRDFKIPLDVLIIDMDWHETYGFSGLNPERDSQGEMKGWTGYTWNKHLFPEPLQFIQWTNAQQLKTALNLHPASGIPTMEEKYAEFARAYDHANTNEYIPFKMSEKKWATVYFDTLLKPMQEWGVDFWWLDWQQHLQDKFVPNLNVTWWLNYTFFSHMEKSGKRPMIFHRWGGLGNHRYPIGFSGDTSSTWETLDFQTYFTATAANVGYAYWSHDIGGHMSDGNPTDGELYLRWIQYGVLSPILRTHGSKISTIERRPWMFPREFFAMREAINFRYSLAPYIYAAARNTYDTGVAFVRPLYYDYPNDDEAYSFKTQYNFGNAMIAAPVTEPINKGTRLAPKKIWLPAGEWFEYSSGTLLKGKASVARNFALDEIPLYIKAGSIIPTYPQVSNLQVRPDKIVLTLIPGGNGCSTELYEDDETTTGYQQQQYSTRKISTYALTSRSQKIVIEPSIGYYDGMPKEHTFDIKLLNRGMPVSIKINGKNTTLATEYVPSELASLIHLPAIGISQRMEITVEFNKTFAEQNALFNNAKGFLRRMSHATEQMKYSVAEVDWGGTLPNDIYRISNILNQLQYHPETAFTYMRELQQLKRNLPQELASMRNLNPELSRALSAYLELPRQTP